MTAMPGGQESVDKPSATLDKLLEDFAQKMTPAIRASLNERVLRRAGVSDILQSAYRSFLRRGFSFGDNRAIWGVLIQLVAFKAKDAARRNKRKKRDLDREVGDADESVHANGKIPLRPERVKRRYYQSNEAHCELWPDSFFDNDVVDLLFHGVDPQHANMAIEILECLSDDLRGVAILKLQGHSDKDIAAMINKSERTIRRWLRIADDNLRGLESGQSPKT